MPNHEMRDHKNTTDLTPKADKFSGDQIQQHYFTDNRPETITQMKLQQMANSFVAVNSASIQKKENETPDQFSSLKDEAVILKAEAILPMAITQLKITMKGASGSRDRTSGNKKELRTEVQQSIARGDFQELDEDCNNMEISILQRQRELDNWQGTRAKEETHQFRLDLEKQMLKDLRVARNAALQIKLQKKARKKAAREAKRAQKKEQKQLEREQAEVAAPDDLMAVAPPQQAPGRKKGRKKKKKASVTTTEEAQELPNLKEPLVVQDAPVVQEPHEDPENEPDEFSFISTIKGWASGLFSRVFNEEGE